jgi:hypothetical protein
VLLGAMIVSGCSPQLWAKPGGTEVEFEGAKASCNTRSFAEFPPMPQQIMIMAGYTTPIQTSCSGGVYAVNCFTTGGNYVPPSYVTVDQNQGARNSSVRSCLMTAGWQPVKNREEANAVTNSGSSTANGTAPETFVAEWDTRRAACRKEADASSRPFPNAFNDCMNR